MPGDTCNRCRAPGKSCRCESPVPPPGPDFYASDEGAGSPIRSPAGPKQMQLLPWKVQILPRGAQPYCRGAVRNVVWKRLVPAVHCRDEVELKGNIMSTTKTANLTFPTHIDMPEIDRQPLIELLNERLADAADLYSQVKQAHWNVKGPNFFQLHQLFDQLAAEVFPYIDVIAERATALGGVAMGTARMAAANSTLPEYPV